MSLSNAYAGRGPFVTRSPAEKRSLCRVFLLAISIPLMILTALIEERRRGEEQTRRALEEALRRRRGGARGVGACAACRHFGELTASIAHEINQPLAAIKTERAGCATAAGRRTRGAGSGADALADIAQDADRASQIIRRIRALFRKEHEEHVAVDINTLIEDVLGLLSADIERRRSWFASSGAKRCPLSSETPSSFSRWC